MIYFWNVTLSTVRCKCLPALCNIPMPTEHSIGQSKLTNNAIVTQMKCKIRSMTTNHRFEYTIFRLCVHSVSFYCQIIVWNLLNKDNNLQGNKIAMEKKEDFLATDHTFTMSHEPWMKMKPEQQPYQFIMTKAAA